MKKIYMESLYNMILDYANNSDELIPRFQEECKDHRSIKTCKTYKEIHAICDALNAIAPYAGKKHVIPSELIGRTHSPKEK